MRCLALTSTGIVASLSLLLLHSTLAKERDTHNPLELIHNQASITAIDNNIQLTLNSTVLEAGHSHQWFELSWKGVAHPSYADWIGLIVPAGSDVAETAPAKYQIAALDPNHIMHGDGKLRFRLINYRAPMQFGFFRGGLMHPILAALSPIIHVQNPNEPLHRHLALTGNSTQMSIQWTTKNSSRPVVKWGTAPGQYTQTTPASITSTYSRSELCGAPATSVGFIEPGVFHSAVLDGLQPGHKYYYSLGDESWGFSPEASFTAAPPVGPDTAVKILAIADMGQGEVDGSMEQAEMHMSLRTTAGLLQEVNGNGYQLLIHNGDISYARGYVTQWDNFMHQIEPIVSQVPYMTSPGNHERDWPDTGDRFTEAYDSGGECGVPFERRMRMPLQGPDKPWYSFDYGPIHFMQYSTEHPFHPGSEQHSWVLQDLAAVDRSLTPWLIVGGHRPFYISSTNTMAGDGDQPVAADLRQAFESVFVEYKVDMTLHGHHHSYQRTCPVIDYKCQEPAPTIATTSSSSSSSSSSSGGGSSSSRRRRLTGMAVPPAEGTAVLDASKTAPIHLVIGNGGFELSLNVEPQPADIWQSIKLWWGYLRIQASGTMLKTEMVSDSDGSVMDSITLQKPQDWGQQYMADRRERQPQADTRAASQKVEV